jgi:hypothetical protein
VLCRKTPKILEKGLFLSTALIMIDMMSRNPTSSVIIIDKPCQRSPVFGSKLILRKH